MQYYSYEMFREDVRALVGKIAKKPDGIVAISRGGLTLAHFLGIALDLRKVYSINAVSFFNKIQQELEISNIPELSGNQTILIVDEIVDSGKSMSKVLQILQDINPTIVFETACLFYKSDAIFHPDYKMRETTDWIEFFWEVDIIQDIKETL